MFNKPLIVTPTRSPYSSSKYAQVISIVNEVKSHFLFGFFAIYKLFCSQQPTQNSLSSSHSTRFQTSKDRH
uniref:Uncharacterized protein n=1 Tax=Rhizophora mucronata TaxID=61149 RepID=A0A2P2QHJ6_RHIMU